MASKLVAFRLPEEIVQAIESQAAAAGSDRTAVVIQALKQVFGLPSSPQTPTVAEELEERLHEVEKKMARLTEQLAKLSQLRRSDSGTIVVVLKLPEGIIQNVESEMTATGSSNTAAAVLQILKQMCDLELEGIPVMAEGFQAQSHRLEEDG